MGIKSQQASTIRSPGRHGILQRTPRYRDFHMKKPVAGLAGQPVVSRRRFCACCIGTTAFAATGAWLTPSQVFAEARNIVDLIRSDAAEAPITVHRLRGNVSVLEGSGGNIAVLTG